MYRYYLYYAIHIMSYKIKYFAELFRRTFYGTPLTQVLNCALSNENHCKRKCVNLIIKKKLFDSFGYVDGDM